MTFAQRYRGGGKRQERFGGDVPHHEHPADDILGGIFRGIVLGGDFYSSNWLSGGGTVPADLASFDAGATTGFYWDVSTGSGQVMGDLWVGGSITLIGTASVFRTGASGKRITIEDDDTIYFYSGDGSETAPGKLEVSGTDFVIMSPSISTANTRIMMAKDSITFNRFVGTTAVTYYFVGGSSAGGTMDLLDSTVIIDDGGTASAARGLSLLEFAGGNTMISLVPNNGAAPDGPSAYFDVKIRGLTDVDTYIELGLTTADTMGLFAGGVELLRLVEGASWDYVEVGADAAVDLVMGANWIIRDAADSDTGLDFGTDDALKFWAGSIEMFRMVEGGTDYNESFVQLRVPAGSSSVPGLGVGEAGSGLFLQAAGRPWLVGSGEMDVYRTTSTASNIIFGFVSDNTGAATTRASVRADGSFHANRQGTADQSAFVSSYLGTATWPQFSFTGDTNTGMFSTGADALGFAVGGVSYLDVTTSGFGYATGVGGAVTQITSKTTGVTLNTVCGQITMSGVGAIGAGAEVTFVLTNSKIATTDVVVLCHDSGGTTGAYTAHASNIGAGSCSVTVSNVTGGSLTEAPVFNFIVIKAVAA